MTADANHKYNLLPILAPRLDPHMLLTLLEFVEQQEIYPPEDILRAKLATVRKTSMVDYVIDLQQKLGEEEDSDEELQARRAQVIQQLRDLQKQSEKIVRVLSDENVIRYIRQDRAQNIKFLQEEQGIGAEDIAALYSYAKITYEIGRYKEAADYLSMFRMLTLDNGQRYSAQLGIIACKVLQYNFEGAQGELEKLREMLE